MNRRAGFTFVELCIAMAIVSMMAMAIAAFASVTTKTWRETENIQQLQVSVQMASGLLVSTVESSRALASVNSDPASVFFWMTDSWNGNADAQAQFAEMGLIEYDATLQTIFLYRANTAAPQAPGSDAATILPTAAMNSSDYPAYFKTRSAWLAPRRALIGPGRVVDDATVITRVESVEFTPISGGDLPAVEMNATLSRGDHRKNIRCVMIVRAPTARPDYANPAN